jgi:molybdate transport system ATP-binding protein
MTDVAVRAVIENRGVDIEFAVSAGEVVAVLGPNGAGKSTALHVIAGLVRPDSGMVRVGDRVLTDTSAGIHVATHDRRVGLLMQDPLLFPHLSVAANVAFSPRSSRAAAAHWLREVDAADLAGRMPRQLSGGQAQRVALDTHDPLAVLTLADRVLVLESGRIVETGSTARVLAAPRSQFAARFAGVNLIGGTADSDGVLTTAWGTVWHGSAADDVVVGESAVAVFKPAAVAVYRDKPHGSPRNTVEVTVAELDSFGAAVRVRADDQPDGAPGFAADITAESAADLRLAPGDRVYFSVKAQEVTVHLSP